METRHACLPCIVYLKRGACIVEQPTRGTARRFPAATRTLSIPPAKLRLQEEQSEQYYSSTADRHGSERWVHGESVCVTHKESDDNHTRGQAHKGVRIVSEAVMEGGEGVVKEKTPQLFPACAQRSIGRDKQSFGGEVVHSPYPFARYCRHA